MTSLAEVVRLATDRAGEARIGDLYAADHDWEWAIAAYRRAITDQPTDDALLDKLATAYQEDGRTREVVPVLASKLATDSNDTLLLLKVAAVQAWFGQNDDLAVTCRRAFEFAKDTKDPATAERTAKSGLLTAERKSMPRSPSLDGR